MCSTQIVVAALIVMTLTLFTTSLVLMMNVNPPPLPGSLREMEIEQEEHLRGLKAALEVEALKKEVEPLHDNVCMFGADGKWYCAPTNMSNVLQEVIRYHNWSGNYNVLTQEDIKNIPSDLANRIFISGKPKNIHERCVDAKDKTSQTIAKRSVLKNTFNVNDNNDTAKVSIHDDTSHTIITIAVTKVVIKNKETYKVFLEANRENITLRSETEVLDFQQNGTNWKSINNDSMMYLGIGRNK